MAEEGKLRRPDWATGLRLVLAVVETEGPRCAHALSVAFMCNIMTQATREREASNVKTGYCIMTKPLSRFAQF